MNFNSMLDDVYEKLGSNTVDHLILPDPVLEKTTTRFVWKNCKAFLKITKTSPDHLLDFMRNQIDNKIRIDWFSESISDGLIIHERTNISKMTNKIVALMKKYIIDFIICKICNKANTSMTKDLDLRKWKVTCSDCNSDYII